MFREIFIDGDQKKKRLDMLLVDLDLADSRNKAVSLIMSGKVFFDEKKIDKSGFIIKSSGLLRVKKDKTWVSRGGLKLDHAINTFKLDVYNKICLDVGCSSGGFSNVLLDRKAKFVYGVDVGYGQIDLKIRNNERFKIFERTNVKNLDKVFSKKILDFVVCDVSFISLKMVLLPSLELLKDSFIIVALIKPQFEVEKKKVGKGGIIKDPKIHEDVCEDIKNWAKENINYKSIKIIDSPILGQKGNKEFFIYIRN